MLPSGREFLVKYQFSSDYDDRRAGFVYFNSLEIDPAIFSHSLKLVCEDGSIVVLAVMNFSDKHVGVVGRVLSCPESITEGSTDVHSAAAAVQEKAEKKDGNPLA